MRSTGVDITEESKQRELLAKSGLKHLKDGEAEGSLRSVLSVEEGSVDYDGNEYHLGEGAVALGAYTQASGKYAHAEGVGAMATGEQAHAEGIGTTASGSSSHAEGQETIVQEEAIGSHAEGYQTVVHGEVTHEDGTTTKGDYAHAEGENTQAYGRGSHAEGSGTQAKAQGSHAEGNGTIANGQWSHAAGTGTTANGMFSHAEGMQSVTENAAMASHAEGYQCVTKNNFAHAEGNVNIAEGFASHAEGGNNTAKGQFSHAEGNNNFANAMSSHAEGSNNTIAEGAYYGHAEGERNTIEGGNGVHVEGNNNKVNGQYAHAEGQNTVAEGLAAHAEGWGTTASTTGSPGAHAEGVSSKALELAAHAEGQETTASGVASHAEGNTTTASGPISHAEGAGTTASGAYSHAEGQGTTASGAQSHAEGLGNKAEGDCSHAEGTTTTASGNNSHAEGAGSKAVGSQSHAEGAGSTANGAQSHAEGGGTTAGGAQSHAEGGGSQALGDNSHAEGASTVASGDNSHTEGANSVASGDNSHAGGCNTIASHESQTAIGKYNKDVDSLFSVGNGEYDEATKQPVRRDAFRVERDGGIVFLKGEKEVKLQDYHNTDTFNFQIDFESGTYYALASWDKYINGTTDTASIGGMNLMMQVTTDANFSQILTYHGKTTNGLGLTMCYYNVSYGASIPYYLLTTDDRIYICLHDNSDVSVGIRLFQIKLLSVNAPNFRLERGTVISSHIARHAAVQGYPSSYLYSRINSGSISGVERLIYTAAGGTKYLNINSDDTIDITGADDNDTNTVDWTFTVNKNAIVKPESVITIPYEDTHAIVLDVKLPEAIVDGGIMPEVLDSYLGKNIVVWVSKKETTSEDSGNLAYPGSMALVNLKFSSFDGKWGFVPELILRNGMKNADLRSNYKLIVDDDGLLTFSIAVRNGSVNDIITTKLLANNFPEAKLVWHNGAGEEYNDDSKTRIKGITTGYVHAAKWAKEDCCLEADGHYLYDSELSIVSKGFSAGSGLAGQMNIDNLYLFPENQSKYTCYIDRGVEHSFGYPAILESARVTVSKVSSEQHITNANTYYVEQEITGIEPSGNSVYYKRVGLVQLDIAEANPITWYPWQQIQTMDVQYDSLVINDDNVSTYVVDRYLLIYPSTSIVSFETSSQVDVLGIKHINSDYSLPNGKRVTILGRWNPFVGDDHTEYYFSTYLYQYRGGYPGTSFTGAYDRAFEDFLLFNKVWYSKGY